MAIIKRFARARFITFIGLNCQRNAPGGSQSLRGSSLPLLLAQELSLESGRSSIFVFAGLMRFLQIAMVEKASGSPTKIFLTDRFIQLTIAAWGLCFFVIIYASK